MNRQCQGRPVTHNGPCGRRAIVARNGVAYCMIHDPVRDPVRVADHEQKDQDAVRAARAAIADQLRQRADRRQLLRAAGILHVSDEMAIRVAAAGGLEKLLEAHDAARPHNLSTRTEG